MYPENEKVQTIAKAVLQEIGYYISENSTEADIAKKCSTLLENHGITDTWYYNCPALVLFGENSCKSISGRSYLPDSRIKVGKKNLIIIDLSPRQNGYWGDCARSFVFENGEINPKVQSAEFTEGLDFINELHSELLGCVNKNITFNELYKYFNKIIINSGFENLDFNGNLGHSIESNLSDRLYVEHGNQKFLKDVSMFTFEPHIRKRQGHWGFKLENIYYFNEKEVLLQL